MASTDQFDLLVMACQEALRYPTNLLRTQLFRHTLQSYENRLNDQNEELFSQYPKEYLIDFLENDDGQNGPYTSKSS